MGSSDHLCEELLVEILSRLPTKSLLRFRSLSKWSYACIGSPDFIRLHARRSPNKLMLVHVTPFPCYVYSLHLEDQLPFNRSVYTTVVDYPFKGSEIISSCNGVVCIYECQKGSITLWNPSIRRMLTIRHPPHPRICGSIGFGYDPIIDDYKILTIDKPTSSFVYSIKSGTWRKVHSPHIRFNIPNVANTRHQYCCFNGALYRVVTFDHFQQLLMRFDLRSEALTIIDLPQFPDSSWKASVKLTIVNGLLAVVSGKDKVCRIWVRIEEEEFNNDVNSTAAAAASWSAAFTLKLKDNYLCWTSRILQLSAIDALLMDCGLVIDIETQVESWLKDLHDRSHVNGVSMFTETLGLIGMGRSCSSSRYQYWGGRYHE